MPPDGVRASVSDDFCPLVSCNFAAAAMTAGLRMPAASEVPSFASLTHLVLDTMTRNTLKTKLAIAHKGLDRDASNYKLEWVR